MVKKTNLTSYNKIIILWFNQFYEDFVLIVIMFCL